MQRSYHVFHLSDFEKAREMEREIRELDGVAHVCISADLDQIDVEAKEEVFSQVMNFTVNICRRIVPGCELKYMFR